MCNLEMQNTKQNMTDNTFKVVYILDSKEVEPVPCRWEENGVLFWPPTKKELRKTQCYAHSKPNKETWGTYACVVKAEGIQHFRDASATADLICGHETTTDDDDFGVNTSSATRTTEKNLRTSKLVGKQYSQFFSDQSELSMNTQEVVDTESIIQDANTDEVPGVMSFDISEVPSHVVLPTANDFASLQNAFLECKHIICSYIYCPHHLI